MEGRVILMPFREVEFPEDEPMPFRVVGAEGRIHRVPFHRVWEVRKDDQRIWHRPQPAK